MIDDDINLNTGSDFLNFSETEQEQKKFTVVVSGLGRSGTSMLANMIAAGGISMGPIKNSIHEDIGISTLIEQGKKLKLRREVWRRNGMWDVWGFKRPLIVRHHKLLDKTLRNPRYVIIFRDPFAVTSRNKLSLGFTIPQGLEIYRKQSQILEEFIRNSKSPMLLLSYEKVLGNPAAAVQTIRNFCGISEDQEANMLNEIRANDKEYRSHTMLKE